MHQLCSDKKQYIPSEWPHFQPGTLNIVNDDNTVDDCFWQRRSDWDLPHFLVLNFTSLDINCKNESVTIGDGKICDRDVTIPHCVVYEEEHCDKSPRFESCAHYEQDDEFFYFHAKTTVKGHGLTLNYEFHQCQGYDGDTDASTFFHDVQLPLIIALTILVLLIVVCVCVRYRKLRKNNDAAAFQQYVTTVASQSTMVPDELPGNSLTFEFSRSYETVPRGSIPLVPVFDIYHATSKTDLTDDGGQSEKRGPSKSERISTNSTKHNNLIESENCFVTAVDTAFVPVEDHSKGSQRVAAPRWYDNVGFEVE